MPRLGCVRVVPQNLLGHRTDWPRRPPAVASWFRHLNPGLLTLREAIATDDYDQVTESLGDGCHVTHHPLRAEEAGMSVASRGPSARSARWTSR